MAVANFGRYISAKLEEVDQKGKYKYSLRQLLWDRDDEQRALSQNVRKKLSDPRLKQLKGFLGRYVSREQREQREKDSS